ncbi:hypothetical protein BGP_6651 [Beggiatoa sp. PS]|nr:hypothetical protein BGP_6651 [Beggiatoa sp. PS]
MPQLPMKKSVITMRLAKIFDDKAIQILADP